MRKFSNKIKACLATLLVITISSSSKVIGEDWTYADEYIPARQVLTGSTLLDIISHRIHRILIIIVFSVLIISLCLVLKTKDKEKKKKIKKVSIIVTFGAVLTSIIYDIISRWLKTQHQQTVYGVMPVDVGVKPGEKSIYPEDTIYSLPEPKASVVNVAVNLAQWIVPIIAFIIGIISFIRILMTKDKELKKKRIRNTIVVLSVLLVLIVGISVAARFLNN